MIRPDLITKRKALKRGDPVNVDANDVALMFGLDKVREAFEQRVWPWPPCPPYNGEVVG